MVRENRPWKRGGSISPRLRLIGLLFAVVVFSCLFLVGEGVLCRLCVCVCVGECMCVCR
jgi:hypothetical protein